MHLPDFSGMNEWQPWVSHIWYMRDPLHVRLSGKYSDPDNERSLKTIAMTRSARGDNAVIGSPKCKGY